MASLIRRLISVSRKNIRALLTSAGLTVLLLTSAAISVSAQNPVPPGAAVAVRRPQIGVRLAHPVPRSARRTNLTPARRSGSPQGQDLYDNGPTDGHDASWTINFGFAVSDSFPAPGQTQINGMSFAAWLFPGDTLTSVEVSITSSEFGGTTYFDGVVNFNANGCFSNGGFNVCTETGSFQPVSLPRGEPTG